MKSFLSIVFIMGWQIFPLYINSSLSADIGVEEIVETDPIYLKGDLNPDPELRSVFELITCELRGNILKSMFHKNVGNIIEVLTNATGETVYETTVNTYAQQFTYISISDLPSGIYTITFSQGNEYMYGEFEI